MTITATRPALRGTADQAAVLGFCAVVWEVFGRSAAGQKADVPPLTATVGELFSMAAGSPFWSALGSTLVTTAIGLAITLAISVPVGLALGLSEKAALSTGPLIDFLRFLPAVAFLPLTLLFFGANREMVVTIVVISAVWPMLIQSMYATQQIDSVLQQVAKAFHLSRIERIRSIYVPSAVPFLMTGLRVSASIALLLSISAEFLGGAPGLGKVLNTALINDNSEAVFALVLVSGFLGLALNAILHVMQRRLLWWHPSERNQK